MTRIAMVAALVWSGAPWPLTGLLALESWSPGLALLGSVAWTTVARRIEAGPPPDLVFCRSVADGLRAGDSLRISLAAAAEEGGRTGLARRCRAGRPFDEVAAEAEMGLLIAGPAVGAAIRSAGASGGRSADVFEAIAVSVGEEAEIMGEIRAATAHVRASAVLIASIAGGAILLAASSGRIDAAMGAGGAAMTAVALGLSLIIAGLLLISMMIRRVESS